MPILIKSPKARPFVPAVNPLVGKTVFFPGSEGDKLRYAGLVKSVNDLTGKAEVRLAIPDETGILMVSDSISLVDAMTLQPFEGVTHERKIRHFDSTALITKGGENGVGVTFKKALKRKTASIDGGEAEDCICDYQDVSIAGYASTFQSTTPSDRDGDYVMPGAFSDTIVDFKKNPVMLMDHDNMVKHIAGSFSKIGQDERGLYIQGDISNAPHLCDVRFKLVEGHLKALSIGGLFMFKEDGRGIERVILYEISLVAVPANQDALVSVRSLDLLDMKKAYKRISSTKGLAILGS